MYLIITMQWRCLALVTRVSLAAVNKPGSNGAGALFMDSNKHAATCQQQPTSQAAMALL